MDAEKQKANEEFFDKVHGMLHEGGSIYLDRSKGIIQKRGRLSPVLRKRISRGGEYSIP